jgi:DNA-binding transcriptional ArsR family regulator
MADATAQPAAAVPVPQDFSHKPWDFLWAVSDPARWTALRELAGGKSLSVLELAAIAQRTPDLMSKHLKILRVAGAVIVVPAPDGDGRKSHYAVPERFRRTEESGRAVIDYGVCVLRFPENP